MVWYGMAIDDDDDDFYSILVTLFFLLLFFTYVEIDFDEYH